MEKIDRYERKFLTEKTLYEMSNLFPNRTGLKYTIWILTKSGREKHGPRIKVFNKDWSISVSIDNNPEIKDQKGKVNIKNKDLKDIYKFILLNKKTLLDHWNGKIDSADLSEKLEKI